MSQQGTVIVLQNGTALNVDGSQPQQPNVIYVQSPQQTAAAPADDLGRFGRHLNRKITKIAGDLLITWGFFAIIGGLMETIGIAIKVGEYNWAGYSSKGYSFSEYSGFWCGALVSKWGGVGCASRNLKQSRYQALSVTPSHYMSQRHIKLS
jgi:hypothetical protein